MLQIKTLFTLCSIFICTMGIAQEDKNYRETPLTDMYNPQNEMYQKLKRNVHFLSGG